MQSSAWILYNTEWSSARTWIKLKFEKRTAGKNGSGRYSNCVMAIEVIFIESIADWCAEDFLLQFIVESQNEGLCIKLNIIYAWVLYIDINVMGWVCGGMFVECVS